MSSSTPSNARRLWLLVATVVILILGITISLYLFRHDRGVIVQPDDGTALSFDGPSDKLERTVIVPTLDTPIPEGKSAIWCLSFQMAWNRFKNDVAHGPIRISGAEEESDRLNAAKESEADLDSKMYYAAAGYVKDGVVEKIKKDMTARFPNVPLPEIPADTEGVAYAYMAADVRYPHAYEENPHEFTFHDPADKETAVRSFGILRDRSKPKLIRQVEVLYYSRDSESGRMIVPREFAVELCADCAYQVVVARLPRKGTLAETLADLEAKIDRHRKLDPKDNRMLPDDSVLVPNMHWRIKHHFRELEHDPLREASQMIHIRFDREGAVMQSEALMRDKSKVAAIHDFHYNRPFLLYLKKRDAKHPFFVMWVDNAELLSR